MKLRIERNALATVFAGVQHSIPSRPAVPALGGVVIRAGVDAVTLSAFDYEIGARSTVAAISVPEPGAVLVSGRLLGEITQSLPDRPVDLSADGAMLQVVCDEILAFSR